MDRTRTISELLSLISSIKRTLQGRTYRCIDGSNLTISQLSLLFAVKQHEPVSSQTLASKLSMTPGAVSQLLDTLTTQGLVERSVRQSDRRSFALRLSPEGNTQLRAIESERYRTIQRATAELTDAEMQLLVNANRKILHALQHEVTPTERN